jgi:hypothetical protein
LGCTATAVDRFRSRPPQAAITGRDSENSYTGPLDRTLIEGIRLFDLNLRGKTVLLKPNLNRDEIRKAPLQTSFTGLDCLWLPRTVLTSDFMVSMPKMKTHHWGGHPEYEEPVRGGTGRCLRLAEKPAALEGH